MDTSQHSSFAQLLKRYRMAAGLSQEALAAQAGLSAHGISDLERGINRSPRIETLALLVTALRLSPNEQATLEAAVQRRRGPRGQASATTSDNSHSRDSAPALPTLPIPPTALVGRGDDVAAVTALLRDEARLLTLAGPGGIGKTRLALQVAMDLQAREVFDSVTFVHLADIPSADLVPAAIAHALGVREHDNRTPHQVLATHLAGGRTLLLLDNFEHVVAAAPAVAALLASCPGLRVLVTSRTLLHVRGERVYDVPPLLVPDRARMHDAAAVVNYTATQLFLARARETVPTLALTDANASLIARICARLDGLPLAIELAAARLKVLAPDALLDRLESGVQVLSGGAHDLPERQRTLRATLAWSYALLDAPAQALFLRLAVFAGGCTLDAVKTVCAVHDTGDPDGSKVNAAEAEPEDLLETVSTLIDNSLLRREQYAGEVRFTMLRTVREYALERLQGYGALDALRRQHAVYFLAIAEDAERERAGAAQAAWAARLERERDNLRAALGFVLVSGQVTMALRLAGSLRWFWLSRGYLSEGRYWLERAVAIADQAGLADALVATALNHAAVLAATSDAYNEASALFERSLAIRRMLGDKHGCAAVLSNLGNVALQQHDFTQADRFYTEALVLSRALGETQGIAPVLGNLGELARLQGDGERAAERATESLTLYTQLQDMSGAAQALHTMGGAALLRGTIDEAATAYLGALEKFWSLGSIIDTAGSLEGLAVVATRRGSLDYAAALFAVAAKLREEGNVPIPPADRGINDDALNVVRSGLNPERFAATWAAGRELSLEQAIGMALDNVAAPPAGEAGFPGGDEVMFACDGEAARSPHAQQLEFSGRKTG